MSKGLRALVACLAILAPVGTAQARTAQATPNKDLRIAHDVVASVNDYTQFTVFDDVSVGVENGIVTLNGKVTMPYKRSEIEKRAAAVDGVREISNRISVLPVSLFDDESPEPDRQVDLRQLELLGLRDHAEPADSHRRGAGTRDAHGRGSQQRRQDAGAITGESVQCVLRDEQAED